MDYFFYCGIGYVGLLSTAKMFEIFVVLFGKRFKLQNFSLNNVIVDLDYVKRLEKNERLLLETNDKLNSVMVALRGYDLQIKLMEKTLCKLNDEYFRG